MRTAGRLRHCGLQIRKWKRFIDVFSSPCNLEGIRRAYLINCEVCSWYTAMNVSVFDGLRSYENIGPRRKHVKIILLYILLWFAMRTLGQLWTCKNRFAFRFDFDVKCCCIFFTSFFLVFHSDFACYFTSINFLFCFAFGFDFGVKCFYNFFHFVFFHSDFACYFTSINFFPVLLYFLY